MYRAVELKSGIPEGLIVEADFQGPSILAYATVSWHDKTDLFFLNLLLIKQTIAQNFLAVICFFKSETTMKDRAWCWQQDEATPHTAGLTQECCRIEDPSRS